MKKIILLIIFGAFSQISNSQIADKFPRDENNNIVYTKIFDCENLSKDQIYVKVKLFFANTFKSANDVIQMDDKDNGIVLGKGNTNLSIRSGKYDIPIPMSFTAKVSFKDNKCKLDIYGIMYSKTISAETMFTKEADERYLKSNQKTKLMMEDYITKTNVVINQIQSSLSSTLLEKSKEW